MTDPNVSPEPELAPKITERLDRLIEWGLKQSYRPEQLGLLLPPRIFDEFAASAGIMVAVNIRREQSAAAIWRGTPIEVSPLMSTEQLVVKGWRDWPIFAMEQGGRLARLVLSGGDRHAVQLIAERIA